MKVLEAAVLPALLFGSTLAAQSLDWQRIVNLPHPPHLAEERFTPAQRQLMEQVVVDSDTVWDDCQGDTEWPHKMVAHRINLGPGHYTLAESGAGCARGGQGANGAMWLLRWDAGRPVMLGEVDGWMDAVLPQESHGLHDVAIGWHNSAEEYGLALYRFNGTRYRVVDSTNMHCDGGSERCTAVPGVK